MKIKYCQHCGAENAQGTNFCISCGEKLVQKKETITICANCGSEFNADEKYCLSCGKARSEEREKKSNVSKVAVNFIKDEKKGLFGTIGKVLLGIVIIFSIWLILLLAFDDGASSSTENHINKVENLNQEESSTNGIIDNNQEEVLDVNDENRADKYRYGIGVQSDQYKALEQYQKDANKGDVNAMVELSDYYQQGIWVQKDTKKAKKLLQQAADAGSLAAKWQLEFLESQK